jgi:hypothetical protein
MSFATLERRLNTAAMRRLANASAVWWPGGVAGGAAIAGVLAVFDREGGHGLEGLASESDPVATVSEADTPGAARGDGFYVTFGEGASAIEYTITKVTRDGTGLQVFNLREAGL